MIEAIIFDLDGTLVQTEKLKAMSYAMAVKALCHSNVQEKIVLDAFRSVVGRSRKEVAQHLIRQFDLEKNIVEKMEIFGTSTLWQTFVQVRMSFYEQMICDPKQLIDNQWDYAIELLKLSRRANCKIGLATMSSCKQAQRVLDVLKIRDKFDFIATRDDVKVGKPDPEIYCLTAETLNISPKNCLVIEDSPTGVESALSAGMHVIAVSTLFTKDQLHQRSLLAGKWIVDEPRNLFAVVNQRMQEQHEVRL